MSVKQLPDVLRDLQSAVEWLRTFRVPIGGTRIARYLKVLSDAVESEKQGKTDHQDAPPFLNALIEASEIIDIATLDKSDLSSHDVLTKLRKISAGAEVMAPTGADPARDYAFEFATAATLIESRTFGGFSTLGGDVVIANAGWPIECKRISSLARIEQRLREGRNQLRELVLKGSPPGIIALDLTRPIRVSLGTIIAPSGEDLADTAETHLTAYIMRHLVRRKYLDALGCPELLGIMARYRTIGTAGESHNIRRSTVWQACSLHPEDTAENKLFLEIAAPMGPGALKHIDWPEIQAALLAVPDK